MATDIQTLLGDQAESLLGFDSPKIPKERLHLPGVDFLDRVFMQSDRSNRVLATWHGCITVVVWQGRGICPFCPWTRALSILPAPVLRRTPITLTRRISSSWRSKADVMLSLQRLVCARGTPK